METYYKQIAATFLIAGFSASVNAETLLECSRIEDTDERVACYDKLAGRVEEKMDEAYSGTTEQRVEARNESIAEEIVGAKEEAPDLLIVEIEKILRDRTNRITYLTTDGRLFKRSPDSRVTFKAGDKCSLRSGVMKSLFLVRDDGKQNKVTELHSK